MDIINLLAGTGAKAPLAGKTANGAGPGAQFASVLENATNVHGTPNGLTLLAASDRRATAAAKDTADQALRATFGPADLLASKDAKTEGKDAPKADPKDTQKSDGKNAPKTGKKADGDDKGKPAHGADAVNPNASIAAAIHSALVTVAAQGGQKTAGDAGTAPSQHAGDAKPGKLADIDGRSGNSRHQLQQLQQTSQAVTSAAASSRAGSDAGHDAGNHGFASQLLSAADASTQATAATPTHADNTLASSAINGLFNATVTPQPVAHVNAPAPAYTATLQAPVGSMPWQSELGQQLIRFSQRGEHQLELHLNPKELGPLQISLHVNDQVAQAHFFAAHAQVRDAVQQALPQLREALAGQGIALGEAMVGQQQEQRQESGGFAGASASSSFGGADTDVAGIATARPVTSVLPLVGGSGVDLYA